jgi:hypothetical protein
MEFCFVWDSSRRKPKKQIYNDTARFRGLRQKLPGCTQKRLLIVAPRTVYLEQRIPVAHTISHGSLFAKITPIPLQVEISIAKKKTLMQNFSVEKLF